MRERTSAARWIRHQQARSRAAWKKHVTHPAGGIGASKRRGQPAATTLPSSKQAQLPKAVGGGRLACTTVIARVLLRASAKPSTWLSLLLWAARLVFLRVSAR
ncbi:hypothetical protein DPSP01_014781 [Paraphaeosphaeria sporulosa]